MDSSIVHWISFPVSSDPIIQHPYQEAVIDERPKSPIEKRKRNLKLGLERVLKKGKSSEFNPRTSRGKWPIYGSIFELFVLKFLGFFRGVYFSKIYIYTQTLKITLHKNPGMHYSWVVIFLHGSNNISARTSKMRLYVAYVGWAFSFCHILQPGTSDWNWWYHFQHCWTSRYLSIAFTFWCLLLLFLEILFKENLPGMTPYGAMRGLLEAIIRPGWLDCLWGFPIIPTAICRFILPGFIGGCSGSHVTL